MVGARRALFLFCVGLCFMVAAHLVWYAAPARSNSPPPLRRPVEGELVARFTAQDRYGPGHRGLDIAAAPNTVVRAAHEGEVSFAGVVAGMRTVSIRHFTGWTTSYSYLSAIAVRAGDRVVRGETLGTVGRLHGSDQTGVHFALRLGEEYIDPAPFMVGVGPVLLPPPSDANNVAERPRPVHSEPTGDASAASIARGCSVSLIDCVGPLRPALKRASFIVAVLVKRAGNLAEDFLEKAAVVTDWAARAEAAAARSLRFALLDASKGLAAVLGHLASLPLKTSSQAALMFEPLSPEAARRIRRRGMRHAKRLEDIATGELQRRLDETFEPVAVAAALREELAVLSRYETERVLRSRSCLAPEHVQSLVRNPGKDDKVYLVVSGLGSSYESGGEEHDTTKALAARGHAVLRFSYRGHTTDGTGKWRPLPFEAEDTYKDIKDSAALLADQLSAISKAYPNKKIVIVAHSQGGVVARYALQKTIDRQLVEQHRIAAFVTLASPHRGSGAAADLIKATRGDRARRVAAELGLSDGVADARSVQQLAWGSEFMRDLGTAAPSGIPTTSISASTDFVVPAHETFLEGASNILVDTAADGAEGHGAITTNPETLIAIEAAAEGSSLCQSQEEVSSAARVSAVTTVGVERLRDGISDALEAAG